MAKGFFSAYYCPDCIHFACLQLQLEEYRQTPCWLCGYTKSKTLAPSGYANRKDLRSYVKGI